MSKSTIAGTVISFLTLLPSLQASTILSQTIAEFQPTTFNYVTGTYQSTSDTTQQTVTAKTTTVQQPAATTFTSTGVPTYPIFGLATVINYVAPATQTYNAPSTTYSASTVTAQSQVVSQSYASGAFQQSPAVNTQSGMLVNQILDNYAGGHVQWVSQSDNPFAVSYGLSSSSGFAGTANVSNTPTAYSGQGLIQQSTFMQRTSLGQTFTNVFIADAVYAGGFVGETVSPFASPEPATLALLGSGLGVLLYFRRKRTIL
ncbi:MAG TPA: PEP-CTERM sorting domain-containing protein [Bryobacteraceae bacterium]|nr:PEP-CTERM sorting domain-containing protein [Bryobacteraceae bacterium]